MYCIILYEQMYSSAILSHAVVSKCQYVFLSHKQFVEGLDDDTTAGSSALISLIDPI